MTEVTQTVISSLIRTFGDTGISGGFTSVMNNAMVMGYIISNKILLCNMHRLNR